MRTIKLYHILLAVVGAAFFTSCKKQDLPVATDQMIHFANQGSSARYSVLSNNTAPFEVGVGTIKPVTTNTNFTISVSSPTGATEGVHYNLPSGKSFSVAAGTALAKFPVSGVFSQYESGARRDTLVFRITSADIEIAPFDTTFTLILRGPCFEGDVVLEDFLGVYSAVEDLGGSVFGPYPVAVTEVAYTSSTTGTMKIAGIFDDWVVVFQLDWTDPNDRKITLTEQVNVGSAEYLYAPGTRAQVRPYPGLTGTFSWCNSTIVVVMNVGVVGVGYAGVPYVVQMTN